MVITAFLLICSVPQMEDTAKVVNDSPAVVSDSAAKDSTLIASLPSAPAPKVSADPEPITPNPAAQPFRPVKPSGAAFDAWTTYRAVSSGYGREANPFMRPFANSSAIYAATQVSPAFMDFLGKRMMVSQHGWVRKVWWLPQAAGASMSFASGAHNVGVVH